MVQVGVVEVELDAAGAQPRPVGHPVAAAKVDRVGLHGLQPRDDADPLAVPLQPGLVRLVEHVRRRVRRKPLVDLADDPLALPRRHVDLLHADNVRRQLDELVEQ